MNESGPARDNPHDADWTRYWTSGALTSLPGDFRTNYEGEIAEFWDRQVERLPDRARVLDACAGNCAVSLLIAERCRRRAKPVDIQAVDAADIDPAVIRAHHPEYASLVDTLAFRGGQAVESLDEPAGSFDLVVSQYGLEYCDWSTVAGAIARLLKPGGRLAMINHTADSAMHSAMREEARQYARVERLGVFGVLQRFADGRMDAAGAAAKLRKPRQTIQREHRRRPAALYAEIERLLGQFDLLARQAVSDDQRQAVGDYVEQLRAGRGRTRNMLAVIDAIEASPQWHAIFEQAGLVAVEARPLTHDGRHRVGMARVFQRPS